MPGRQGPANENVICTCHLVKISVSAAHGVVDPKGQTLPLIVQSTPIAHLGYVSKGLLAGEMLLSVTGFGQGIRVY